jgi:hypothetical protein
MSWAFFSHVLAFFLTDMMLDCFFHRIQQVHTANIAGQLSKELSHGFTFLASTVDSDKTL